MLDRVGEREDRRDPEQQQDRDRQPLEAGRARQEREPGQDARTPEDRRREVAAADAERHFFAVWTGALLFWSVWLALATVRGIGAGYLALHWVWPAALATIVAARFPRTGRVLFVAAVIPGAVVTVELGMLFLTYFLQQNLRYSPVKTGLAFLPMIAALIAASTISSGLLMPRLGPRLLVPAGLIIAAGGQVLLAAQLSIDTSYPTVILPALLVIGTGLGLVFGCAMNAATYGAATADAGVASAMVNTCQQVGGSIGTALLNTIAASALSSYLVTHGRSPAALAGAAVHSYAVAFWVSAAIFAGAAVVCGLVLRSGVLAQKDSEVSAMAAA